MNKLEKLLEVNDIKKFPSTVTIPISGDQLGKLHELKRKYGVSIQQLVALIISDYFKEE